MYILQIRTILCNTAYQYMILHVPVTCAEVSKDIVVLEAGLLDANALSSSSYTSIVCVPFGSVNVVVA